MCVCVCVCVLAKASIDQFQSQVEPYQRLKKWYLITSLVYTQHHKVLIKGKLSNTGKREAIEKGAFG